MPSNVDNTQAGQGQTHTHDNEKTDDPAHDVQQSRAGGAFSLLIDNQHGSNNIANANGAHFHVNANDDGSHSVTQTRSDGSFVVIVQNNGGFNIVTHAGGDTTHVNTMNDGWVV
jgi:hypothetical protein